MQERDAASEDKANLTRSCGWRCARSTAPADAHARQRRPLPPTWIGGYARMRTRRGDRCMQPARLPRHRWDTIVARFSVPHSSYESAGRCGSALRSEWASEAAVPSGHMFSGFYPPFSGRVLRRGRCPFGRKYRVYIEVKTGRSTDGSMCRSNNRLTFFGPRTHRGKLSRSDSSRHASRTGIRGLRPRVASLVILEDSVTRETPGPRMSGGYSREVRPFAPCRCRQDPCLSKSKA